MAKHTKRHYRAATLRAHADLKQEKARRTVAPSGPTDEDMIPTMHEEPFLADVVRAHLRRRARRLDMLRRRAMQGRH